MEKINIAEALKDCPKGMELDCTVYNNITLEYVCKSNSLPICVRIQDRGTMFLSKYGQFHDEPYCKCIIFPKGKTTWEGFQRPFKDGDILYIDCTDECDDRQYDYIFILDKTEFSKWVAYCHLDGDGNFFPKKTYLAQAKYQPRFATEEEKEKLFQAIKDNGLKWNAETKTLKKLVIPKFKIGDRIKYIYFDRKVAKVVKIYDNRYELDNGQFLYFQDENAYEISYDKFDISTLVPFESKVLVRDSDCGEWRGAFWDYLREKKCMKYDTSRGVYRQCIPYNDDTKHLLGKTDDCDEYYKTWK